MNAKKWMAWLLVPVVILVAGFGLWQLGRSALNALIGRPSEPTVPERLVTQINVGVYPADPDASRTYTAQSDLTRLLRLLRNVPTSDPAPDAPSPENAAFSHAITLIYADGSYTICYILEDQYVRLDDGWFYADPTQVEALYGFLELPPGASSPAETTAPETTAPAEETTAPSI